VHGVIVAEAIRERKPISRWGIQGAIAVPGYSYWMKAGTAVKDARRKSMES
jgi:hypothetical protein